MRPVKNKRRIDPRYFLNEAADRDNLADDLTPLRPRRLNEVNERHIAQYNETLSATRAAIEKGDEQTANLGINKLYVFEWIGALSEVLDDVNYEPVLEAEGEEWANVAAKVLTSYISDNVDPRKSGHVGIRPDDMQYFNARFQRLGYVGNKGEHGWALGEDVVLRNKPLGAEAMIRIAQKSDRGDTVQQLEYALQNKLRSKKKVAQPEAPPEDTSDFPVDTSASDE